MKTTAKANYNIKHSLDGVTCMFLGNRARYSQLAVHYIVIGNTYDVYSPVRQKIKDFYRNENDNKTSVDLYNITLREARESEIKSSLERLNGKGLVKHMLSLSEDKFVHWLKTKKGMTSVELKNKFGLEVSDDHEDQTTYKGSKILFGNINEKKKEEIMSYISKVEGILSKHGFGSSFKGDIVISKLSKKLQGLYFNKADEIHIDPNATDGVVEVLCHEYSHKIWNNEMSEDQKNLVRRTYRENIKNTTTTEQRNKFYRRQLFKGQDVLFKDENFPNYHNKIVQVRGLGPSTMSVTMENSNRYVTIPWGNFLETIFQKDGSSFKEMEEKESNMFPSSYSKTDPEEWLAECFAFFLMDKASKGVSNFIKTLYGLK